MDDSAFVLLPLMDPRVDPAWQEHENIDGVAVAEPLFEFNANPNPINLKRRWFCVKLPFNQNFISHPLNTNQSVNQVKCYQLSGEA